MTDKPYTLENYTKQILEPMTQRFAEDLQNVMGYVPPTKWQRFKYQMQDIKQRFKDVWTIVSGGDIHKDCGY